MYMRCWAKRSLDWTSSFLRESPDMDLRSPGRSPRRASTWLPSGEQMDERQEQNGSALHEVPRRPFLGHRGSILTSWASLMPFDSFRPLVAPLKSYQHTKKGEGESFRGRSSD